MTETTKVEIVGESASAVQAMRQAADAVKSGVGDIKGHFESLSKAAESVNTAMLAVGAVLAGGKLFKEAVAETKQLAIESINLGRSLGISASEASGYATAIDDVGGTTNDFADASRGLTRQLKTNEKGLNQLGIETRDAHGNLRDMRDLMLDAIETVNGYASGTDRALAAQIAFGRGANVNSPVLKLTKESLDEAAVSAAQLGLVIGQQSVDAFQANKKATAEANDVLKGLAKAVGDALLPVLTQLAVWFREIGPTAILIVKGAVGGLVAVFWGLVTVVRIVWDSLVGFIQAVWEPLKRLGESLFALVQGDWAGAKAAWDGFGASMVKTFNDAHNKIADDARDARDKIWNLFAEQDPSAAPGEGKHVAKSAPDDTVVAKRRAVFTQLFQEAYQSMKELVSIEETGIAMREKLGAIELSNKRDLLQQQVQYGLITQAQEIEGERNLEQERYAIERQGLMERMKLVQQDEVGRAKVLADLKILEAQHQQELSKLEFKSIQERRKNWTGFFQSIDAGFKQVIAGFLQGTRTLAGLFKGIFDTILGAFANMLAEIVVQWLKTHILARVMGKVTALASIQSHAAEAGAAGIASMAGAPWPMDMTAPAFGAAMAGAAASYATVASARGGFDIPAGVNPLTQLHEREMVLPAGVADQVRGSFGASGGTVVLKTQRATATHDLVSRKDLAKAMKQLNANFAFA